MKPDPLSATAKQVMLPLTFVEGMTHIRQGDYSYRVSREGLSGKDDAAASLVNSIAEELDRLKRSAVEKEQRLSRFIETLSQILTQVASGDFSAEVPRDYSGDAADVLAYLVNTTVSEIAAMVEQSRRHAEEDKDRLEKIVESRTAELRLLATTDSLTNTLNRYRFFEVAEEECARCLRYNRPLVIAMLDLDHFKAINDRHGHAVGDDALRFTAKAIRRILRQQDRVCRYGGEEFVILMPETEARTGFNVLERVRGEIRNIELRSGEESVPVRVSVGVTKWHPPESIEQAIKRADENMYKAKAAGRDRVVMTP